MRHSFLRADTKNRFPCSRPWPRPCAGTKGAFAVPPGLKRFQRVGKARLRRSFPTVLKKCLRPRAQTPRPPGKAGRYDCTLEGCGPPNLPEKGAERVFTFVCAGYRGRAVGDWPRKRRDGGAPGSVTALAAGEAALLARDRGARGSRAFPARGRERGYFTTDGRGLQRGNEAARGLPAASKKLRVFSKKRLTK